MELVVALAASAIRVRVILRIRVVVLFSRKIVYGKAGHRRKAIFQVVLGVVLT